MSQRGFALIELVLALLVVAVASAGIYAYLEATKKSLETLDAARPINYAAVTADMATLAAIQTQVTLYQAQHGRWPPSREAVLGLLRPPPRFQCAGNDFTYDPPSGALALVTTDPGRC